MTRARRWGSRLLGPAFDYLLFLRPRQWPILTAPVSYTHLTLPTSDLV